KEHRRQIAEVANRAMAGKINATTQVTLNANATTTTVKDSRIGAFTYFGFQPTTQDAVTAQISGLYVSAQANGQATLTHASSASTDQPVNLLLIG
ncbi:hypothetical protein VSR91_26535, partial [Klebsiella pneumoniae]|uniref:hypothetical protein n=1 Tax=Klebsiella pneumoniae TaxID=573 RepID=UPI002DBD387A